MLPERGDPRIRLALEPVLVDAEVRDADALFRHSVMLDQFRDHRMREIAITRSAHRMVERKTWFFTARSRGARPLRM